MNQTHSTSRPPFREVPPAALPEGSISSAEQVFAPLRLPHLLSRPITHKRGVEYRSGEHHNGVLGFVSSFYSFT